MLFAVKCSPENNKVHLAFLASLPKVAWWFRPPGKAPSLGLGELLSEEDSSGLPRCRLQQGGLLAAPGLQGSRQGRVHRREDGLSKPF